MKKILLFILTLTLFFLNSSYVNAQQGCCSWHDGESGDCSSNGKEICNDGTESPTCYCSSEDTETYDDDESDDSNLFTIGVIAVAAMIGYSGIKSSNKK